MSAKQTLLGELAFCLILFTAGCLRAAVAGQLADAGPAWLADGAAATVVATERVGQTGRAVYGAL